MNSDVSSLVTIQASPQSVPATPSWFGEVAAFAQVLRHTGMLKTLQEEVRFARARFGQYDLIDFGAVLIGYVVSGEPTLLAFYERLAPFAEPFMALFGRNHLPHRSTLSRYLSALDWSTVEALRTLFQKDLLARTPFPSSGGLFDRTGAQWVVIDVDGTRQAARQRVLPQTDALPAPGAYASVSRHVWRTWERGLPGRPATGHSSHDELCCQAWASSSLCAPAIGWPVW